MTIEQSCFLSYYPDPKRLQAYGFVPVPGGYFYETLFFDGQFQARIFASKDGQITGEVLDSDTGEIYTPIRSDLRTGAFVSMVRAQYEELLKTIAARCCVKMPFSQPQTNRLARYLKTAYNEDFDHPFSDPDSGAVWRAPGTDRWYALVMQVQAGRIPQWDLGDENEKVEIINLKADPEKVPLLIKEKGIFPAYHMNHKLWISVLLDGTLSDEQLITMVLDSRRLVGKKGTTAGRTQEVKNWIIPANPSYYPVQNAFDSQDEILWKQSSDIRNGDIVYMYAGAPYSCVLYKCEAIETHLPGVRWSSRVSVRERMRLRLLERYPEGVYTFSWLKTVGILAVRGPRSVTDAFLQEIGKD